MESDWCDLVGRFIEIIPVDAIRRTCEIVKKANTGVRSHGIEDTVLSNNFQAHGLAERKPGQSGSKLVRTETS